MSDKRSNQPDGSDTLQGPAASKVRVILFSGGRGSQVLSEELIGNPRVDLTVAINGYDDGASTGDVRRFLGEALGPSDFRKNGSRLARALRSCAPELVELLDLRLPESHGPEAGRQSLAVLCGRGAADTDFDRALAARRQALPAASADALRDNLEAFLAEPGRSELRFGDCSLGNLVFAGCYLRCGRRFNPAIEAYCALLGLPPGLIENVSDGTNAHLVAIDRDRGLLAREAEIVDATRRNHVRDIFLLDHAPDAAECERLASGPEQELDAFLATHSVEVEPNSRLLDAIAAADLVIYAPGTQHSSLLPSYLTKGLGEAIARNLKAIKLLITNLQEDAEIPDLSAVELVERAVYYLKGRNQRAVPTPSLVTHYLINDPKRVEAGTPYLAPGPIETLEDPRLVRIANYEQGSTGRHNAERLLTPFIESFLERGRVPRVSVLLLDTDSLDKLGQTLLEALRGGLAEVAAEVAFFYASSDRFDDAFVASLPFRLENVTRPGETPAEGFLRTARSEAADYVLLFESSGMYRGEEIVNLVSLLGPRRLDAVWGSRRFSVRAIRESYRLRYRKNPVLGALSYVGSHLLSLSYLLLYGRYLADTLSGARAVRTRYLEGDVDLAHKLLNQQLLSRILGERGEIFETPVRFFSMSPDRVTRTTVWDGLVSLLRILGWRFQRRAAPPAGREG